MLPLELDAIMYLQTFHYKHSVRGMLLQGSHTAILLENPSYTAWKYHIYAENH